MEPESIFFLDLKKLIYDVDDSLQLKVTKTINSIVTPQTSTYWPLQEARKLPNIIKWQMLQTVIKIYQAKAHRQKILEYRLIFPFVLTTPIELTIRDPQTFLLWWQINRETPGLFKHSWMLDQVILKFRYFLHLCVLS